MALQGAPGCPEQHGEQAYAHPEDCSAFFLCVNGTLSLEHCENGLLFDGHGAVHNHCNYHWAVNCGERKADREFDLILLLWVMGLVHLKDVLKPLI